MARIIRNGELIELSAEEAAVVLARGTEPDRPAPTYRDLRAAAYRDELGDEKGDFIKTLGDVLDVMLGWAEAEIAAGRAQATLEIQAALAKRAEIKARHPKP